MIQKRRYFLLLISLIILSGCFPVVNTEPLLDTLEPTLGIPTGTPPANETSEPGPAASGEAAMEALYETINGGVVSILTYDDSVGASIYPAGQGSGFVYGQEGYIITNQHVIDGADAIEVDFSSGLKSWAVLVGTDPDSDLAVLRVDVPSSGLNPIPLGDSDLIQVGHTVVAIGNPYGLSGTMTTGVISALGRTLASEHIAPGGSLFSAGDLIQTDAAINPGNSGGPLLNMAGEVIGVNRAIRTESFTITGDAANSGVGFAIPINIVRRVVPAIIADGAFSYPYLGVSSLDESLWNLRTLELLGLPPDSLGAYITEVTPDSPAAQAGLMAGTRTTEIRGLNAGGDLIIALNGVPVANFSELLSYLLNHTEVGSTIELSVLREGKVIILPLTIGARP
ncbi:MAG: trypsin-like peptidase domain-containing protein [Anaerolineales bacterium]|nr:trypsin-like peptidase domain-containing protein [Anaerolineales bacterium]